MPDFLKSLPLYVLPIVLVLVSIGLLIIGTRWFLFVRGEDVDPERNVRRHLVRLLLTGFALVSTVLIMSRFEDTKESAAVLTGLLGVGFSAAITISSATFISNAMAGLMMRAVQNFRLGDYLRVGDEFGRVSERGIFHVEIQTEQRDLVTFPNLFLVSQPVTVVRASGTIISTQVSLGYDVPHQKVEAALIKAAADAELKDPFVYILSLGDFSITYQIAATLSNVKHLLSARSRLRTCVVDSLHADRIEIVSPTFTNQKRIAEETVVIAHPDESPIITPPIELSAPEDRMFDKAEYAQQQTSLEKLSGEIADIEVQITQAKEKELGELQSKLQELRTAQAVLKQTLDNVPQAEDDA